MKRLLILLTGAAIISLAACSETAEENETATVEAQETKNDSGIAPSEKEKEEDVEEQETTAASNTINKNSPEYLLEQLEIGNNREEVISLFGEPDEEGFNEISGDETWEYELDNELTLFIEWEEQRVKHYAYISKDQEYRVFEQGIVKQTNLTNGDVTYKYDDIISVLSTGEWNVWYMGTEKVPENSEVGALRLQEDGNQLIGEWKNPKGTFKVVGEVGQDNTVALKLYYQSLEHIKSDVKDSIPADEKDKFAQQLFDRKDEFYSLLTINLEGLTATGTIKEMSPSWNADTYDVVDIKSAELPGLGTYRLVNSTWDYN
ncbi:hypothetical protein ACOJQI_20995 [Bacillus salacetis]|uniref:hypothetical protein n=1 Tax=Bacillus salacetis TaxID=2315464 RepID=UPI003BA0AF75